MNPKTIVTVTAVLILILVLAPGVQKGNYGYAKHRDSSRMGHGQFDNPMAFLVTRTGSVLGADGIRSG